jgi:Uma2 family endonuclease
VKNNDIEVKNDDLRAEYDPSELRGGVRGKYLDRYRAGTSLKLLDADPGRPDLADRLFRIDIETYHRMGEFGLITPSDRVELLDGLLVRKMTKGPRHVTATHRTFKILLGCLPPGWHPRVESPVEFPQGPDGDSAPEPDVVVVRGDDDLYNHRHPGPGDVLLVIQVADSSLLIDRKGLRRFGWAGVPVVWIVNLRNETVEVYTGPSGPVDDPGFAQKVTRGVDDLLEIPLDGRTIGGLRVVDFLA